MLDLYGSKIIREERTVSDGMEYVLKLRDIENYGIAEFAEVREDNGKFRKANAMMPFEYLNKGAKDFRWDLYGENMDSQKKVCNSFVRKYKLYEEEGKGLYIHSKTKGTGKTLLSCCLANELMDNEYVSVKFIPVLDFIEMTKKSFNAEYNEVDAIFKARLLILDDIGAQMKKEWVDSVLYRLINYRSTNKLVTIFTSNVPLDNLGIDERIIDRIRKMTIPLSLPEVGIRRMLAEEENSTFVKKVLEKSP